MVRLVLAVPVACLSSVSMAQDASVRSTEGGTIAQLLAEGYEIKAAVPNGKRFVVFLQKDSNGYACEMANLTRSQCGKLN